MKKTLITVVTAITLVFGVANFSEDVVIATNVDVTEVEDNSYEDETIDGNSMTEDETPINEDLPMPEPIPEPIVANPATGVSLLARLF